MTPTLLSALERRLALLPRLTYATRSAPPERFRISHGPHEGLALFAPHPRDLAEHWLRPAVEAAGLRVARDAGTLYLVPLGAGRAEAEPLDVEALADDLARLLWALPVPEDPATADALGDLRLVVEYGDPAKVRRWLRSAAVLVGTGARPLPAPRRAEPVERGPALSVAERQAVSRDRKRERADETARAWLALVDLDEYGGAVTTTRLWADAQACLSEWLADYADDPEWFAEEYPEAPEHPAMPGRTRFLALASEVFDRRIRRGVSTFVARAA